LPVCDSDPSEASWPFAQTMIERDVVESTSDLAAELVASPRTQLPLVVWAHRQTRGRGRGSHNWWSDTGSLTFTLAIDPAAHGLPPLDEPLLALSTAVAMVDGIRELGFGGLPLGIRWPNDIECGGKKLGGILPEVVQVAGGRRLLIGAGLNLQTNLTDAPVEIRAMATSLADLAPLAIAGARPRRLLSAILERFGVVLRMLVARDTELAGRWNELDVLRGRTVRVDVGTHVVEGRGGGIDSDGALRVDQGGTTIRLYGGTVLRSSS
jgi:BirA family transcriptional regulator, biotin operon repressor / biotin---[acetyl-CoA-carboxylase] ligase